MKKFACIILAMAAVYVFVPFGAARAAVSITVSPSGLITSTCYTKADAEAEQAIRIRSELMVIGLNCQASSYRGTPENLYAVYREFVANHGPQFATWEAQMLDYFGRAGSRDREADLNAMETVSGNQFSLAVAQVRPDIFCYKYSPRLLQARGMSPDKLLQWVHTPNPGHPLSHPMCQQ